MAQRRRYVLLDRDGTIIVERDYLRNPHQVALLPGAAEGLRQLNSQGLGLIVVTNQSGIGRGYFDGTQLAAVNDRLRNLLVLEGVQLDALYVCPHRPEDDCRCRKPKPGLVEQAVRDFHFLPEQAFVIGDKTSDVELGRAVGATTLLVRSGYGAETEQRHAIRPDHVVDDLAEAAEVIQETLLSNGVLPHAPAKSGR